MTLLYELNKSLHVMGRDPRQAIRVDSADRVVSAVGVVVSAVLGGVASQEATEGRVVPAVAEELVAAGLGLVAPGAAVGEGARPAARERVSEGVIAPRRAANADRIQLGPPTTNMHVREAARYLSPRLGASPHSVQNILARAQERFAAASWSRPRLALGGAIVALGTQPSVASSIVRGRSNTGPSECIMCRWKLPAHSISLAALCLLVRGATYRERPTAASSSAWRRASTVIS
jgi:hypothetical protein